MAEPVEFEADEEGLAEKAEIGRRALLIEVRRGEVVMARGVCVHVGAVIAGCLLVAFNSTWRVLPAVIAFVVASILAARGTTSRSATVAAVQPEELDEAVSYRRAVENRTWVLGREVRTLAAELATRREANAIRIERVMFGTWALTAGAALTLITLT